MPTAELGALAYAKIVLHALKYPHCGVMGILIGGDRRDRQGGDSSGGGTTLIRVGDVVPVRHELAPLALSVELALAHIDVHCQSQQGATIVGVYFANESFVDSSLDSFVCRVAEKIVAQFPAAVIVQLDNRNLSIDSSISCCKAFVCENKTWKSCKLAIENEENSLAAVSAAIQRKLYREIVDFDNHLDDPGLDFWNSALNQRIEQLI